tara:strand:+ start:1874 stop:2068 length:195 start_codon:yes stop_codon:yes gene_type:complete
MSQTKLYKLIKNIAEQEIGVSKKGEATADGLGFHMRHIPFDESNIDYQEYKLWLADGNTPEAAD